MTTPTETPRGPLRPQTRRQRLKVGRTLRDLRIGHGITQAEFAAALGLKSQSTVSKIENGIKGLSDARLKLAADILDVQPSRIRRTPDAAAVTE